ncbi:MAG: nickel pincer cofactor biosynthesis protein LarC [Chloroflexi bacterium]|nr:nickel pincer cofactor biosynthesis protein LarC [Chloroflexota bacterium]
MNIAYFDCFSGISGDMALAALLDAGLPLPYLKEHLMSLQLQGLMDIGWHTVRKGSMRATALEVKLAPDKPPTHCHWPEIAASIRDSALPERVKDISLSVFQHLAEAEAHVHDCPIDEVHFHEVGAVDSIVDIVGTAIGLDHLNIEHVYASALPLGSGQVVTQHGLLPVPAPATLELLRMAHAPVLPSPAQVELVTPTGAAILAALAHFEQPAMCVTGIGIGAGQRDLPWPNIIRLIVGEQHQGEQHHAGTASHVH